MDLNDEEKMDTPADGGKRNFTAQLQHCWNGQIMENFTKANLFIMCCVAAGLLLISYLAAFSCEVSWLLEAHGDLPTASYLLCAGYFIMFVASTILIHGLVTGLPWGLFSWSVIIGCLSIPELAFVMMMTTQYWGLQSTHGLTELIGYLIRLIINCLALLCVIPTALKWRRETQVLSQLQTLATRLQLQTPPPSAPMNKSGSLRGSKNRRRSRRSSGVDNPGYLFNENQPVYGAGFGSHNEFNASIFGMHPGQFIGQAPGQHNSNAKRTQSLMDLRYVMPTVFSHYGDKSDISETDSKFINNNIEHIKNINEKRNHLEDLTEIETLSDPIYSTIDTTKSTKLARNCVSLENLGGITKIKNDLSYGNNLLQNYHLWHMFGFPPYHYHPHHQHQQQLQQYQGNFQRFPIPYYNYQFSQFPGCGGIGYGGYTNPYANRSNTNSKQSIGNESDDYRKYRDVAL